jgi:hypothetical protein
MAAGGGKDLVLGKFDASGAHRWSQRFGDAAAQFGTAVATLPGSNRVVVVPSTSAAGPSPATATPASGWPCSSPEFGQPPKG